jgi:hypothetical protein
MLDYSNCKTCPHKGVAYILKHFFMAKTGDTIFENCFDSFDNDTNDDKCFCLGETKRVNWVNVCEDWKKEYVLP